MKCPKCQFEIPEGAKFCNECGNKLEIACSACGKINSLSSKFCSECGHKITIILERSSKELSFDEKLAKIQRYLPKGLSEKILAQRDKIEGERKQVTVMFCDMEGYTSLNEKLGSEEMYSIMDQVYEILIHKVHDYEGTVKELTGDGIEADQRNRMIFHLGKDYALYADLFKRKGDRSRAQENLGKAIEIFKECGAEGWVEKYEKVLAQSP
jgi:hypothetical protein